MQILEQYQSMNTVVSQDIKCAKKFYPLLNKFIDMFSHNRVVND